MSDDQASLLSSGEDFVHLFKKGAEFTKDLLRENERLRRELAAIRERQESAARNPEDWDKLRQELLSRIQSLEQEYASMRQRLEEVEGENHVFAERYIEVEEENNNLANLYVASYQLHSTLDLSEVLKIIIEIVINLVGAEIFAIYEVDPNNGELRVAASEGVGPEALPRCSVGEGPIGEILLGSDPVCIPQAGAEELSQPLVCIPLCIENRPIGAIAIFRLLQQKGDFSALDHELFSMLGGHAATAIFASKLYSQSERKLNTIQGFIDLLTR